MLSTLEDLSIDEVVRLCMLTLAIHSSTTCGRFFFFKLLIKYGKIWIWRSLINNVYSASNDKLQI